MFFFSFMSFLLFRTINCSHYSQDIAISPNEQNNIPEELSYSTCESVGPHFILNKDNYIIICGYEKNTYQYTQIFENYFNCSYSNIVFELSSAPENLDSKIKDIISTLTSINKIDSFFIGFSDPDLVFKYGDLLKQINDSYNLWIQVAEYPKNCLWDYEYDYSEKWKDLISKTRWHFSCRNNIAYLHYNSADQPIEGEIVYLSTATTIAIICSIVLAVIVLIASLCLIANCRYKKLVSLY